MDPPPNFSQSLTMTIDQNQPAVDHTTPREIVFIDSRLQDAATLLQGLRPGAEVVYLNAAEDGLQQMAAALGEQGDVGTVHVLAHGSAGQLWVGSSVLDASALQAHSNTLAALGRGLTADGDVLVYACDLAQGDTGLQFVNTLAALTGADVAASNNRTGATGDWALEVQVGEVAKAELGHSLAASGYAFDLAANTAPTFAPPHARHRQAHCAGRNRR